MIELRHFSRTRDLEIAEWAIRLGASSVAAALCAAPFKGGFVLKIPLMDTTIYLAHLATRFSRCRRRIRVGLYFGKLDTIESDFDLLVSCSVPSSPLIG